MSDQKRFGRWRVTGNWVPFIETTLDNGESYFLDAKNLQGSPEHRRSMFERLAEKEGISPQDIADFQAALQSLGSESQDTMAAKLGLNEDDLRKEKGE